MTATYDFSQTRNQIIFRALRIAGVTADENDPTPSQISTAAQALESLVKHLQSEGTLLWSQEDRTVAVIAGMQDYTLATDVLGIEYLNIRDSNNYDYRVGLVLEDVFKAVSQPTKTGRPEMAKLEMKSAGVNTLSLWPVPDLNYTGRYKCIRKLADFDTALGTPEMPQRWYDPLCYLLAANLADEYQLPLEERAYLTAKARALKDSASGADHESADTIYLYPI